MAKTMTTEEYIEKAIKKHGTIFDYSKVIYYRCHDLITIKCKIHGDFILQAYAHLSGKICPKCSRINQINSIKIPQEEVLNKCRDTHGNKYDYSKSIYYGSGEKMLITCLSHGDFWQTPHDHISGHGCKECGFDVSRKCRILSFEDFKAKADKIFNNKYTYNKIDYDNNARKSKLTINCLAHGDFIQSRNCHLNGHGCQQCGKNKRLTPEITIKRSKIAHGNLYDYSLFTTILDNKKMNILCKEHGVFIQRIHDHMRGVGCPQCGYKSKSEKAWLKSLNIPHLKYQNRIYLDESYDESFYIADAYDPITNTIYEFDGDFWHGNLQIYDPKKINSCSNLTFEQLYNKTIKKRNTLIKMGYNFISIWESEFLARNQE
jgi:hypothetical protein